jgi:hypothetical protein
MPGFGSSTFGAGGFGVDPVSFGPDYQRVAPPAAAYFDPLTRDFLLDAEGRTRDMGTIEQQVALAFATPRGKLAHAKTIGHDFLDLPRFSGAKLDAEIDRFARRASPFDSLLSRGLVELLPPIDKLHPKDTETRLAISWRKTGETAVRTANVVTG